MILPIFYSIFRRGITKPPESFPIVSLIDKESNTEVSTVSEIEEQTGPTKNVFNPSYAPEEFTYNQDPIVVKHEDQEIFVSKDNIIKENLTLSSVYTTETTLIENFENLRQLHLENKLKEGMDIGSTINCNASKETGFCALTPSYPTKIVEDLIEKCREVTEAFQAVIPDDADSLGDNSVNVISSEKDLTRPWSWKVYAYKKRQVCDSELSFVRPSYALSTTGKPRTHCAGN